MKPYQEYQKASIKELVDFLSRDGLRENMKDFVVGFLTQEEIERIGQRIKIIELLKSGKPQHEIALRLGVGVATVSRGSRMLKEGHFDWA